MAFLKDLEWDNLAAIVLIGGIAITAMVTNTASNTIVVSVVSGLIGYIAKGNR